MQQQPQQQQQQQRGGQEGVGESRAARRDAAQAEALPWVEKYRPRSLGELIAHEEIVSTLQTLMERETLPHLLFYGPPGTGKTSTILACAQQLHGGNGNARGMTLELNASDDRGIDVVRNEIKTFAGTKKLFSSGIKLIVLDEADALTNDAQFALRRVIEKYTKNARFCLICNYVNKIIPALQSRCTKFRFAPLRPEQIRGRLGEVAERENVNLTPDGAEALLRLAQGDMRRVLNLLQSTSMGFSEVTADHVYLCAGAPLPRDVRTILRQLLTQSMLDATRAIQDATREKGYSVADLVAELVELVWRLQLPPPVLSHLLDALSNIEHRLSHGGNEKFNTSALVGAFIGAREMMTPEAAESVATITDQNTA